MVRTMGVDQVAGGVEVSVAEWAEGGVRAPVFDGVLRGSMQRLVRDVLMLAQAWDVHRALVDPSPDSDIAMNLVSIQPEVFAIQRGSQHNAASLAETAFRRSQMNTSDMGIDSTGDEGTRLVSVERDLTDETKHAFRVYVPSGEPMPTHLVVPLLGGETMERLDGSMVVEKVISTHEVPVVTAQHAVARVAWPKQTWALAPTTTLPPQGWSLACSVYRNNALVHEQVVTENQMMGLSNLATELDRDAVEWIERGYPSNAAGPWRAEFTVFAGQTQIHQEATGVYDDPAGLKGAPVTTAAQAAAAWISANAVAMEQQYPAVNLPAEDPFALPPIELDTFDYDR